MQATRLLALIVCAAGASTALSDARPRVLDATTQPSTSGAYRVQWTSAAPSTPVDIFVASQPYAPRAALQQLADDDADGEALVTPKTQGRPYFYVTANGTDGVWTAERVLPLEGGRNFRDLGGYATGEGQRVKWGKVYRSGSMAELTDNDYRYLGQLGIRVVCDFRTTSERTAAPNQWQAAAKITYWTRDYEQSFGDLRELLANGSLPTSDQAKAAMLNGYRRLPFEQAPSYRELFKRLAAEELPLAFNCSAGKDRAGTAAALVLSVLGVPRETVVEDYSLSDKVVDYKRVYGGQRKEAAGMLASLPEGVISAILSSDPDYIRAALSAIDEQHGSVESYVRDELGLSAAEIERIRAVLLE